MVNAVDAWTTECHGLAVDGTAAMGRIGVADMLRAQMVTDGISGAEARRRFHPVGLNSLLTEDRTGLTPEQRIYAQPAATIADCGRPGGGPGFDRFCAATPHLWVEKGCFGHTGPRLPRIRIARRSP
ncbi:malic enzyme-like NAD(P)-binding protein [Streptosporangium canum]|uniref:malic enzyme-like NAD(P)-binding protein n=1 Tax=Streptosporangium canum TaxID=324952 RepID=UPI0034435D61